VVKTVIFSLQVGFTGNLTLTVLLNCVSGSLNFDTAFPIDWTKFCSVFLSYRIGNLLVIPKMYLKQSFSDLTDFYSQICP